MVLMVIIAAALFLLFLGSALAGTYERWRLVSSEDGVGLTLGLLGMLLITAYVLELM